MFSGTFILSIFVFYALFALAGSVLLAIQFRKNRPTYISYWIIGLLATSSGVILLSLKDYLPEFISYKVGNGLTAFGAMMGNYALSNLSGNNGNLKQVATKSAALGVLVVATLLFLDTTIGNQYQPAFIALLNCSLFSYGYYVTRKYSENHSSIFARFLMLVELVGALLWMIRLLTVLFLQVGFAYQGGPISTITYIILLVIGLLRFVSFEGLVLEIEEKEKHEILSEFHQLKINLANQKINHTEQRLQHVLNVTGDGIWDWNIQTGEVKHNDRWLQMLCENPTQEYFSVEDFKNRIHPDDVSMVMESLNEVLGGHKEYRLRYRMIRLDGHQIWVEDKGAVVEKSADGQPTRMVGAISDISEEVAAQEKVQELIFFDPLTKLPNRQYIKDRIHRAISESNRTGVYSGMMYLDLDNFKTVNDSYGHHVGDILLEEFGRRMQNAIRPSDIVARIGGDEYLILFERIGPNTDSAKVALDEAIKRILASLDKEFDLGQMIQVKMQASMGVVIFGAEVSGFDELLKCADIAMYAAKEDPNTTYRFFDPDLKTIFERKNELHLGLKEAASENQFYVEYQPVVDRDQAIIGYEALARWKHPLLGMVMPDDFIPFAEKSGQMNEVGESILRHIFSDQSFWTMSRELDSCTLMINVSAQQLMNSRFDIQFISLAEHYEVPLDRIHLEVTEGTFLTNTELAVRTMERLSSKGVKFILDDFGTGYSSLAYLQKLPIQYLKLDKSFVAGMNVNGDDQAIVENILNLAKNLNLKVIAEGVETKDQFNSLRLKGCDFFQGWHFGRPGKIIG